MNSGRNLIVATAFTIFNICSIVLFMHARQMDLEGEGRSIASKNAHESSGVSLPSPSPAAAESQRGPAAAKARSPSKATSSATQSDYDSSKEWVRFQDSFGKDLVAEFLSNQHLSKIELNMGGVSKRASPRFDIADHQQVKARAQEILEAAYSLLGVEKNFPPIEPVLQNTEHSAQVTFRQTYKGITLKPHGSITITLGSEGQLKSLYSDYVIGVIVENELTLDASSARNIVQSLSPKVDEGVAQVLWVTSLGDTPRARYAYEFHAEGWQTIIDAQSGEILSRKDKRQR